MSRAYRYAEPRGARLEWASVRSGSLLPTPAAVGAACGRGRACGATNDCTGCASKSGSLADRRQPAASAWAFATARHCQVGSRRWPPGGCRRPAQMGLLAPIERARTVKDLQGGVQRNQKPAKARRSSKAVSLAGAGRWGGRVRAGAVRRAQRIRGDERGRGEGEACGGPGVLMVWVLIRVSGGTAGRAEEGGSSLQRPGCGALHAWCRHRMRRHAPSRRLHPAGSGCQGPWLTFMEARTPRWASVHRRAGRTALLAGGLRRARGARSGPSGVAELASWARRARGSASRGTELAREARGACGSAGGGAELASRAQGAGTGAGIRIRSHAAVEAGGLAGGRLVGVGGAGGARRRAGSGREGPRCARGACASSGIGGGPRGAGLRLKRCAVGGAVSRNGWCAGLARRSCSCIMHRAAWLPRWPGLAAPRTWHCVEPALAKVPAWQAVQLLLPSESVNVPARHACGGGARRGRWWAVAMSAALQPCGPDTAANLGSGAHRAGPCSSGRREAAGRAGLALGLAGQPVEGAGRAGLQAGSVRARSMQGCTVARVRGGSPRLRPRAPSTASAQWTTASLTVHRVVLVVAVKVPAGQSRQAVAPRELA